MNNVKDSYTFLANYLVEKSRCILTIQLIGYRCEFKVSLKTLLTIPSYIEKKIVVQKVVNVNVTQFNLGVISDRLLCFSKI